MKNIWFWRNVIQSNFHSKNDSNCFLKLLKNLAIEQKGDLKEAPCILGEYGILSDLKGFKYSTLLIRP